jgi:hypothetical protein
LRLGKIPQNRRPLSSREPLLVASATASVSDFPPRCNTDLKFALPLNIKLVAPLVPFVEELQPQPKAFIDRIATTKEARISRILRPIGSSAQ